MSERRAARRPQAGPEAQVSADLARFKGNLNDPKLLVAWAEARLASSEELPRMHALERAAMRAHGVWRTEFR